MLKHWEPTENPSVIHVLPMKDILSHREGQDCPCQPKVECKDGSYVVVHNAWDCREYFKESNGKVDV